MSALHGWDLGRSGKVLTISVVGELPGMSARYQRRRWKLKGAGHPDGWSHRDSDPQVEWRWAVRGHIYDDDDSRGWRALVEDSDEVAVLNELVRV